jgi:hypothetical protein
MFVPRLREHFESLGEEALRSIIFRLASGRGARGKALAPKKRGKGPLGGKTVAQQVSLADVIPRPDGFRLLAHGIEVTVFHAGTKDGSQPARPIMSISSADRRAYTQRTADELARQITAHMARGGAR